MLIKSGESKDSATMRGRDVEFDLKDVELHPTVKQILYKLAEINHLNSKAIAELAAIQDQIIDNMGHFANIAANMKQANDKFNTYIGSADVDDDVDTRSN